MARRLPVVLVLLVMQAGWLAWAGDPPDGLKALKHPDPKVRLKSVTLLLDLGPVAKFAIPELKECLKDADAQVRVKAAECLFGLEPDSTRTLLPVLTDALKDKDAEGRIRAAAVLAKMGKSARNAVPALVNALKEKDIDLRLEAALALGEIGPGAKKAVAPLLETIREEDGDLLEPTVSVSLGQFGLEAVADLTEALADKHAGIRRASCVALGLIGKEASDAVAPLTERLNDREASIRAASVKALGQIGASAKSAEAKVVVLLKDESPTVRINAALTLWQLTMKTTGLPVLSASLKEKNAFVREQACKAIIAMGKAADGTLGEFSSVSADPDPKLRALSADALAVFPQTATGMTILSKLQTDEVAEVRLRAVRALVLVRDKGKKEVGDAFAKFLKSDQARVRLRTVEVLGELGKEVPDQVPFLMPLMRDPDPAVRRATAITLKKIDPDAAAKAGIR